VLPVTVKDKDGKPLVVKDVSRIVPLNGGVAEVIFALGLTKNVVGVDTSATYPAKAVAGLPKIGYQRTLSSEGILVAADDRGRLGAGRATDRDRSAARRRRHRVAHPRLPRPRCRISQVALAR
jgi:hypothetical protein